MITTRLIAATIRPSPLAELGRLGLGRLALRHQLDLQPLALAPDDLKLLEVVEVGHDTGEKRAPPAAVGKGDHVAGAAGDAGRPQPWWRISGSRR